MSLRSQLIRIAHGLPANSTERKSLLAVLSEEGSARTAINWDEFGAEPAVSTNVWKNYNTIGRRQFVATLGRVLNSAEPGMWMATFDPVEIERVTKKWKRLGSTVNERGVKGLKIMQGFKTLFIGVVGGKKMAVMEHHFKL